MFNAKRATLTILGILGLLVFTSASGDYFYYYLKPTRHNITATEDTVFCKPQRSSSDNLWTCTDYYGNQFKDLIIIKKDFN